MPESPFDRKLYQHDAFDKSVFRDLENARNAVRWIFRNSPDILKQLDLDHLEVSEDSYLDEELRESFVDVLYQIPLLNGECLCVFILIELKTSSEKFTMFQILKYIIRIWDALFKKADKEGRLATFLFPMVFPVIIYHGEARFTAPTEMAALQDTLAGYEQHLVYLEAMLCDFVQIPKSEFPEDPELWSAFTVMQSICRPNIDEQLFAIYQKIYPLFDRQPNLLDRWRQILWYAISSGKHFTKEKCDSTINKIKEIRGDNMSTIEQPVYLIDVLMAEGEAKGEVRWKADALLRFLTARFKTVPKRVIDQISRVRDSVVLDSLTVTAATCLSLKEFEKELN